VKETVSGGAVNHGGWFGGKGRYLDASHRVEAGEGARASTGAGVPRGGFDPVRGLQQALDAFVVHAGGGQHGGGVVVRVNGGCAAGGVEVGAVGAVGRPRLVYVYVRRGRGVKGSNDRFAEGPTDARMHLKPLYVY